MNYSVTSHPSTLLCNLRVVHMVAGPPGVDLPLNHPPQMPPNKSGCSAAAWFVWSNCLLQMTAKG